MNKLKQSRRISNDSSHAERKSGSDADRAESPSQKLRGILGD
jgi:hypothetical protein